jgi:hypothetical protein
MRKAPEERLSQWYEKPIEALDLSVQVFNSLKRTGITTVGDALDLLDRGPDAMLAIRNFGEKSLEEVIAKLKEKGYLDKDAELPAATDFANTDERLKWLARTQQVNGSWEEDIETTAAAVLAFVRSGHTTRTGSYRAQVRKAALWLQNVLLNPSGFPVFAGVRALRELEAATGDSFVTDALRQRPATVTSDAERVALALAPVAVPNAVTSLDDLRIVALAQGNASAPSELKQGDQWKLVQTWLAVGQPT